MRPFKIAFASFGLGLLTCGSAMASATLYVSDFGSNAVYSLAPSGELSTVYNQSRPNNIATDGSGALYISDFNGTDVIPPGSAMTSRPYGAPNAFAFDGAGNLFTTDPYPELSGEIDKIAASGNITRIYQTFSGTPQGIAVDHSGDIYFSILFQNGPNSYGKNILKIAPDGSVATFVNGLGGYFTIDPLGNLFVPNGNVVDEVSPLGAVSTFATLPNSLASYATFGPSGELYVAGGSEIGVISPAADFSMIPTGNDFVSIDGIAVATPEPASALTLTLIGGILALAGGRSRARSRGAV